MRKISIEKKYKPLNLTPYQLSKCNNDLLKEKLNTNKEVLGEKAVLMKRKYDKKENFDFELVKHPSSTCTIFNFNNRKNSPENFNEIFLEKLKKDDSMLNFDNTRKEILTNQGSNYMSNVGFGNFFT